MLRSWILQRISGTEGKTGGKEGRSESVVSEYMDKMDVLLVGPHYASALPKFKAECEPHGIKVDLIPADIYSTLDGAALVDFAVKVSERKDG